MTKKKAEDKVVEKLKREIEENKKLIEELETRLKYMQADFENYKKHIEREKERFEKLAEKNLITDLLEFLDDMESAIKNADEKHKKGIQKLLEKIVKILSLHGLEEIRTDGRFDPYYHEAVMQGEGKEGQIIEELQKGYMLNGIVIRHAKVKVGKGSG